jgi:hypothetical protein
LFNVTLHTRHRFDSREKAAELFEFFNESGGPFKPARFGQTERVKGVYDAEKPDEAIDMLARGGGIMLKAKKYRFLLWIMSEPREVSTWHMWVSEKFFDSPKRVEEFVAFIAKFCERFPVLFGSACPKEDWDAKHVLQEGYSTSWAGASLDRCVPGVYWMTVFGPPLVEHFGRGKFEGLPVRRVLDLGAGGLGIVLRETPYEPEKSERLKHDAEIASLLGEEYFFDLTRPKKECKPVPGVTRGAAEVTADADEAGAEPGAKFTLEDLKGVTFLDATSEPVTDLGELAEMLVVFLQEEVADATDYSRAALEAIDAHFAAHPQTAEYKPEHLNREFLPALGAYFGEVLVRRLKAKWVEREPLPGSTLKIGDTEVSPFEVAYRSVYEGARLSEAFDRLARLPGS